MVSYSSFANNSNTNKKSKHLTYQEYINKFGVDFNSNTIIKLFFDKVSPEKECNYKKLDKALSMYQTKNKIDEELKAEIEKIKQEELALTDEGYDNLIQATLKKINQ